MRKSFESDEKDKENKIERTKLMNDIQDNIGMLK